MRALAAHSPRHDVRSGDGGTVEQGGRFARPRLEIPKDAGRDRLRRLRDSGQISCDRRNAKHGAARSWRTLAAMLVSGVIMRGTAGIGVVLVSTVMLVRSVRLMHRLCTVVHMRGGRDREPTYQARRGVAERQRHTRRKHARKIEQGDKPPCLGAYRPRQANQHGCKPNQDRRFSQGNFGIARR